MQNKFQKTGWIGLILLLSAYVANLFGLATNNIIYHIANFLGAICVALSAGSNRVWPPTVLNIIWAVIALIGIVRAIGK